MLQDYPQLGRHVSETEDREDVRELLFLSYRVITNFAFDAFDFCVWDARHKSISSKKAVNRVSIKITGLMTTLLWSTVNSIDKKRGLP